MPRRNFRVGRSATGLGLFAVKPIARSDDIVAYSGRWIATEEAQRRERTRGVKYMFEVDRHWTIDGSSRRNLGRYVNHSCEPNAEAVLRARKMMLIALRAIAPGEEITIDYGEEYFDLFLKAGGCRCAACAANGSRKKRIGRPKRQRAIDTR